MLPVGVGCVQVGFLAAHLCTVLGGYNIEGRVHGWLIRFCPPEDLGGEL